MPVDDNEAARIKAYVGEHGIRPRHHIGARCPLYIDGTCAVYAVRPRICAAFGHSHKMECPRGYNENVPESELVRWIVTRGKEPVTTIHQVFGVPLPWGLHETNVRVLGRLRGKLL